MTLSHFVEQLNRWGRERTPFFFVVDFEMEKPFACELAEAASKEIFFDIHGFTNSTARPASPFAFVKQPIHFSSYQEKFNVVARHLHYGDTFLANLTIRTPVEISGSLRNAFDTARAKYKLLFRSEFLVFSPETFIRTAGNRIYSYPMKGTIDAAVAGAKEKILGDKKETAEHVTIVDLIRNDMSQVASDIVVRRFRYAEEVKTNHKNLWQVSSEIEGKLPGDHRSRLGELLTLLLPAGSVSGAPKTRTLEVIKEAEVEKRGYYTGVFGYFDGNDLDSGVMIRFVEQKQGKLFYRSGGGITAQSDPALEYQEAIDKIYVPVD